MRKNLLFWGLIIIALFTSCYSEKTFEVKGQILSGSGEIVYFEHRALDGVRLIDSVKLKENGDFKFKASIANNPEFYHLRAGNNLGVFAVDADFQESLYIVGDLENLARTFSVANSPVNDQLKHIDQATRRIQKAVKDLEKQHSSKEVDDLTFLNEVDSLLLDYKADLTQIVLGSPTSAAAYYAIFQRVNDYLVFDPYNKKDYSMYAAVATSWDKYYNDMPRTKHLYDFTMNALMTRKGQERQAELLENTHIVTESSLPDINLRGVDGKPISLASLKGKVVIMEFTVYSAEFSPKHNIGINSIYNQYKNRGVEVYQISFDSDEHMWKNAASNLPWVTVRDPESVYSRLLSFYNVRDLPTAFILDKNGDVIARVENYETLGAELEKVL